MQFNDPNKVATVIRYMQDADQPRARNRARVLSLFNGEPPYTEAEARDNHIETNVNFLESTKIAHDARQQFYNAFLKPGTLFNVRLYDGPPEKRIEWGNTITREINCRIKRSAAYDASQRSTFASTTLHGIGPTIWQDKECWVPIPIGIEDLLIPSNVDLDLSNLGHFAVFRRFSLAEFHALVYAPRKVKGWNMGLVNKTIATLEKMDVATEAWDSYLFPEKIVEQWKSNAGYWGSDAVPQIRAWDFYFQEGKEGKWHRRILLGDTMSDEPKSPSEFLFDDGDKAYCDDVSQILHLQVADGANKAPFKYHSVRGIGFLLYAVCHLQNRARCMFSDAAFLDMSPMFRNIADGDRERVELVRLYRMAVIPNGLNFVPANERHQVNDGMIAAMLAQNRQLMSEHSGSFTRDINDGTQKEMTAYEAAQRANSAAALVNSVLNTAYTYEERKDREICRRFCIKGNTHPDIKKFQKACKDAGVPDDMMDVDKWEIQRERVMGAGNKMLELAQARALVEIRSVLDPDSQRMVDHIYVEANTDDPKLAEALVPLNAQPPSPSAERATLAWGTLMMGMPVVLSKGLNHIDYVNTLLSLLDLQFQEIEQNGGTPPIPVIEGLSNVVREIISHVQIIAQNKLEASRVKRYGDALRQAGNYIKAYAQRAQESQQGQPLSPEAQAKIQQATILAESTAKINEMKAEQKMRHKEVGFQNEQQRKSTATLADIQRKQLANQADIASKDLTTQADVIRDNSVAAQEVTTE